MPHATDEETYTYIKVEPLHPTVGAAVLGVDFSKPVPPEVFAEIRKAITKHGVLVFRHASLDDTRHVAFASLFGELDDVKPYLTLGRKNRFAHDELFDVSNLEDDGSLVKVGSKRDHLGKGNSLFHVDSSFNPRRASFSLLRAHELPPLTHGGNTDFADTRTAYDDLPPDLKTRLETKNYIAAHSLWHSRKSASPEYFRAIDPTAHPMSRHRLLQTHEASGRRNIYIAAHAHHIEGLDDVESTRLLKRLMAHCTRPEYVLSVEWVEVGDLVVWDNTCVMHRGGGGDFAGRYKRDMRRCTVHDGSEGAWGLNERSTERMGLP